ncbi:MAG: TetR/AcrR family transcriptional regulator [Chloroflexota bacterium]
MKNQNKFETIPIQTATPSTPLKRPKRADAIANRALILETAQHLFAQNGIDEVCMAAIAEAAGIGKGTLYRAFTNKGDLCLALMDEDMRLFQNKILQMLAEGADQPPLKRLDVFLDQLTHFLAFHAPLLREVQRQGGLLLAGYATDNSAPHLWLPWLRETIMLLLQQAEQQGEAADLDIPYLADAILAPLNPDIFMYQREVLGFDIERISRGVRRLVLSGCRGVS